MGVSADWHGMAPPLSIQIPPTLDPLSGLLIPIPNPGPDAASTAAPPPPCPCPAAEEVARLDSGVSWARALDGSEYMPGLVGLNNMKQNDYANVVVQALIRVYPIRWGGRGGGGCG